MLQFQNFKCWTWMVWFLCEQILFESFNSFFGTEAEFNWYGANSTTKVRNCLKNPEVNRISNLKRIALWWLKGTKYWKSCCCQSWAWALKGSKTKLSNNDFNDRSTARIQRIKLPLNFKFQQVELMKKHQILTWTLESKN